MTEAEIDRIETALEISLPRVYRNLMVPFPLRSCRGNSDTELWDDSDRLIEENKQLRFGLFGGVKPWPKQYFCLGGAGSGVSMRFCWKATIRKSGGLTIAISTPKRRKQPG